MRVLAHVLSGALLCLAATAQDHAAHKPAARPVTMVTGLGSLHHPVSTHNAQAQQFFDQGLRFIYAFNHDEAVRAFREAARLDPDCAMAYWGIAMASGIHYNDLSFPPEKVKIASEALAKARQVKGSAEAQKESRKQALEDMVWALLTSKEFLFNY